MPSARSLAPFAAIVTLAAMPAAAPPAPAPAPAPASDDGRLDWWRDARFGLFIHWGLYAIPAGEWKDRTDHGEWILTSAQIPVREYEEFIGEFNPVRFDAREWARLARAAGMKYIVITSKHHDGFCLFDSAHTDYDIMATPFQRDVCAELADACRREGLRIGWYHSIMDWHHPDYLPRRGWEDRPADDADFDRYVDHLHDQVTELLTNYGDIGVMWFDGEWESTWTHEHGQPLYQLCRELQPDVIVNNRVDKGRAGMAGMTADSKHAGDFGTPEQEIPPTGLPGVDWETCMTMNRHWGYNRLDDDWKSPAQLIRMLVDIASKGGNFLLNVGPTADGTFPEPCVERLRAIGDWMSVNGESIHGTDAGPFTDLTWGRCTSRQRGSATLLYLHVFDWPPGGVLVVPGLSNDVRSASLLADSTAPLPTQRDESDIHVQLPLAAPDPVCSVVVLEIDGAPLAYARPRIEALSKTLVRSLPVTIATEAGDVAVHYTLDGTAPVLASPRYGGPITIDGTRTMKARSFIDGRPVSPVAEARFERAELIAATPLDEPSPGLMQEVYDGEWTSLPKFDRLTPARITVRSAVGLDDGPAIERVGRRFRGYLRVPRDDVYTLALASDDGSRLTIAGRVVVENDGLHVAQERRGTIPLAAGWHEIIVEYFNRTGEAALDLRIAPLGEPPRPIAPSSLSHG